MFGLIRMDGRGDQQRSFAERFRLAFGGKAPTTRKEREEILLHVGRALARAEDEVEAAREEWKRSRESTPGPHLPYFLARIVRATANLLVLDPSESWRRKLWSLAKQAGYSRQELDGAVSRVQREDAKARIGAAVTAELLSRDPAA